MRRFQLLFGFTLVLLLSHITLLSHSQSKAQSSKRSQAIGLKPGNIAPGFELPLPDGSSFTLSELRGKVVLLSFWASWCKGCRNKSGLIKVYNEYKDVELKNATGFAVVSVSLDRNREAWLKAIEDDGLVWEHHVCDSLGLKSPIVKTYRIDGLPRNLLIDANGIIIKGNVGSEYIRTYLEGLR